MADDDEASSGVPTRAIHEAYLDLHRSLKDYRQAVDRGAAPRREAAHGDVQESVITLYELLRPHLRNEPAVEDFWNGEPPEYPYNGEPPDPDDGTAILAYQIHTQTTQLDGIDPDELEGLEEWHESLEIPETIRLAGLAVEEGIVVYRYQAYEMGLRRLDEWGTTVEAVEEDLGGLMRGKTSTSYRRHRVPIEKLERAARELADVARDLGFLSDVDPESQRTEITPELMERVDEWLKQNQ